jgi:hypothetical protein
MTAEREGYIFTSGAEDVLDVLDPQETPAVASWLLGSDPSCGG